MAIVNSIRAINLGPGEGLLPEQALGKVTPALSFAT